MSTNLKPLICRIILWPLPIEQPFRMAAVVGDDGGDTTIDEIPLTGSTIEQKLAQAMAYAEAHGTNVEPLNENAAFLNIHRRGEIDEDHRMEPIPVIGYRFTLTKPMGSLMGPYRTN